jgi:hypothetical protein
MLEADIGERRVHGVAEQANKEGCDNCMHATGMEVAAKQFSLLMAADVMASLLFSCSV